MDGSAVAMLLACSGGLCQQQQRGGDEVALGAELHMEAVLFYHSIYSLLPACCIKSNRGTHVPCRDKIW